MENSKQVKKLSLMALILMIFTSVFGFTNMPRAFYLMGYAAIPFYIISAILFSIPYAFMMAEYGAAFKNERGGIYSWMEKSVGPKYAFVGTFMWYASYVIWMVNICSTIWVPLSNAFFGEDRTGAFSMLGLSTTETLGVLGVIFMLIVTLTASKGVDKIQKVSSIGGTAVALLNIVLIVGAIIIFVLNKCELAQPILDSKAFLSSPNPSYQTPFSMLSFLVFAIFAFGGIEAVGGLVDQTENPEQNFPKGLKISAIIIAVGYAIGILMCGVFTNWNDILSSDSVNMGNIAYVMIQNLGYQLGYSMGLSENVSLIIGAWSARFVGLSMFLALVGAFFTLCYSPLKQLLEGTPKELWPGKMGTIKDGMPKNGMWIQFFAVSIIIVLVSFGGEGAGAFFAKLILMTNVAMTIPYMFLSCAFIKFKNNDDIEKPFEIYKSKSFVKVATIVVTFVVGFANVFTIIEPATRGNIVDSIWMVAGPVVFTIIALLIYGRYEKKMKSKNKGHVA